MLETDVLTSKLTMSSPIAKSGEGQQILTPYYPPKSTYQKSLRNTEKPLQYQCQKDNEQTLIQKRKQTIPRGTFATHQLKHQWLHRCTPTRDWRHSLPEEIWDQPKFKTQNWYQHKQRYNSQQRHKRQQHPCQEVAGRLTHKVVEDPQHQEVDHQEEDLQYQEEEDLQHQEEEDKQRPLLRETHTHLGCVATCPKYSMAINRRPIDLYRNSSDIT